MTPEECRTTGDLFSASASGWRRGERGPYRVSQIFLCAIYSALEQLPAVPFCEPLAPSRGSLLDAHQECVIIVSQLQLSHPCFLSGSPAAFAAVMAELQCSREGRTPSLSRNGAGESPTLGDTHTRCVSAPSPTPPQSTPSGPPRT